MIGILIGALFLFILGISLMLGKGSWMISGYNTMSKEEKANCDIKKISRAVGIFLLMMAVSMGIMAFVTQYAMDNDVENIIGHFVAGFTIVAIVGIVILVIILQKYDKNKR
jgi:hypothetical protein